MIEYLVLEVQSFEVGLAGNVNYEGTRTKCRPIVAVHTGQSAAVLTILRTPFWLKDVAASRARGA